MVNLVKEKNIYIWTIHHEEMCIFILNAGYHQLGVNQMTFLKSNYRLVENMTCVAIKLGTINSCFYIIIINGQSILQ